MPYQPAISGTLRNKIVAHLRDGRVLARGYARFDIGEQDIGVAINLTVTVPDLRYIEHVIHVQFDTDPLAWIISNAPMNKRITGNVVGMSIYYLTAGTTLGVEVIAIGPP